MKITTNKLPKSQIEITVELSAEETKPYVEKAAQKLGETAKIDGFRKGHVPYETLKNHLGEMAIYEAALEDLVNSTYQEALKAEKIEAIGQPEIEITKMAPGNALEYKAKAALLPEVKVGDVSKAKLAKKEIKVEKDEVAKALNQLTRMQSKEAAMDRELKDADKAVVDMEMFINKVPVEGGQAPGHKIYLTDEYFIPGLKEKILGMKKGETREFELPFPKDHHQKNLAGKTVEFKVKLNEVFEVTPPKLDDEFAKSLGQKSMAELETLMEDNIKKEKEQRENERFEQEALDKLVDLCTFGDIPEVLIAAEIEKMLGELKRGVAAQGMEMSDYLTQLKKTEAELKLDFAPMATKRAKMALASRQFAIDQKIEVSEEEVDKDIAAAKEMYKDDEEMQKQIASPESRAYVYNSLKNRKAIKQMMELMTGEKKE